MSDSLARALHAILRTEITRHVLVKGEAFPDDPTQARYWAERRRKNRPPLTPGTRPCYASSTAAA